MIGVADTFAKPGLAYLKPTREYMVELPCPRTMIDCCCAYI